MKFTLSWLKEHLETTADINQIAETLTRIGLEVEEVINPAENLKGFISAQVETYERHPDSDHLGLLTVNTGKEKLQVVCGAPNCKQGLIGIFAPVGTLIPCYNEVLKVGKIRGVESFGMMCSEKELGIGEDHNGIIELDSNTTVGVPASEILPCDPIIEISITPNRAECLGVRGVARDLAAAGLGTLKPLNIRKTSGSYSSPIKVEIKAPEACKTYVGRYIKNVNNKAESPKWLKDRLTAIGLRSISPLVDITNYINYDMARPLHVFDADKLNGNICVRMANDGEKFISLEEKEYALDCQSLGICDNEGIQCLGGIMGGAEKGCSAETTNVFVECALFTPENIARTGRHFQIDSDSRYRYERWVDPKSNILGSDYATQLILDICGGEASDIEIAGSEDCEPRIAYIRPDRIKTLIGLDIEKNKIVEILSNLGFECSEENGKIKTISPTWRGDIEGEHDLVEEVVRMIGLDNIPAESLPHTNLPKVTLSAKQHNAVIVKHELANRGMLETVTWSFTDENLADMFRQQPDHLTLINPIATDLNEMRPSILPNLLIGVKNNVSRGFGNVAIFEVGPQFYGRKPTEQQQVASGIRYGLTNKKHWSHNERPVDVYDVKADALAAIAAANGPVDSAQITTDTPNYYHPGRSGTLRLGKNVLAYFGELHPSVCKKFGLKQRVYAFEVFLDNIPLPRGSQGKARKKLELSSLQAVEKDLAFVVDKKVKSSDIIATARTADRNTITDVRLFDIYEGENLPEDKKSVAITVTYQPTEKSFTDKELEVLMQKVIVAVENKCGGQLRQ